MASSTEAQGQPAEPEKDAWKKVEQTFNSKQSSQYFDPCQDFANASIKCLKRNAGDKTMCQDYFQAYRDCKKEWTTKRKEAKKAAGGNSWFS